MRMVLKFFITIVLFSTVQCYTLNNTEDVIFYLYRKNHEVIALNDENSNAFNSTIPTKVIVHGFNVNANSAWIVDMAKTYLKIENCNVIAIDWSKLSSSLYVKVALNAEIVAGIVADGIIFLASINNNRTEGLKKFHLIGHSVGAHLCGEAGDKIYKKVKTKVARVTGLDPAGPYFDDLFTSESRRLKKSDGDFVDVIHTSSVFGYLQNLGQVDFYVNGGYSQPQCKSNACSHSAAHVYFEKSITSPDYFVGTKCKGWHTYLANRCKTNPTAIMGEYTPAGTKGTFFVKTDDPNEVQ